MLATDWLQEAEPSAINRLKVAKTMVGRLKGLVDMGATVDEHTADQVLVYAALADGQTKLRVPSPRYVTSASLLSDV